VLLALVVSSPPEFLFFHEPHRHQEQPHEVIFGLSDPLCTRVVLMGLLVGFQFVDVFNAFDEVGGHNVHCSVHELGVLKDHFYDVLVAVHLGALLCVWVEKKYVHCVGRSTRHLFF